MRSESFRALCGDLADAEIALQRWQNSTLPEKVARCSEYTALVDGLRAELKQVVIDKNAG